MNESCCQRPQLAAFLDQVALEGPGIVFDKHAQVMTQELFGAPKAPAQGGRSDHQPDIMLCADLGPGDPGSRWHCDCRRLYNSAASSQTALAINGESPAELPSSFSSQAPVLAVKSPFIVLCIAGLGLGGDRGATAVLGSCGHRWPSHPGR